MNISKTHIWLCILTVIIAGLIFGAVLCISACNYQPIDLTWDFDYAYIKMPDGTVIEGECNGWRDYEDGDQLQVTIGDTTYLTHAANVVLIAHSKSAAYTDVDYTGYTEYFEEPIYTMGTD